MLCLCDFELYSRWVPLLLVSSFWGRNIGKLNFKEKSFTDLKCCVVMLEAFECVGKSVFVCSMAIFMPMSNLSPGLFPNWSWQQVKVVSHRFYASVDIANSFIISRCILSGELKFADIRRAMRRKSALNKMPWTFIERSFSTLARNCIPSFQFVWESSNIGLGTWKHGIESSERAFLFGSMHRTD